MGYEKSLFKEGDKVRHKSNNTGMVIIEVIINEDCIEYMCEWLDGGTPVIAKFKESALNRSGSSGLCYL
nr:MAG TPA: putative small protein [Caudoviricetes sp.]